MAAFTAKHIELRGINGDLISRGMSQGDTVQLHWKLTKDVEYTWESR